MMGKRPDLTCEIDSTVFRSFYYLKEELIQFCKANGIPANAGKLELTERIALFLDTGMICREKKESQPKGQSVVIRDTTVIETGIVCSERHRAFFIEQIGSSFSFCVPFQAWLKNNAGKTYADAVAAYFEIVKQKKIKKTTIEPQFEYNTYIRIFFLQIPNLREKMRFDVGNLKKA